MGAMPPTPSELCRCVLPEKRRGMDYGNGFGVTWCGACGKHLKWGCADFDVARPTS